MGSLRVIGYVLVCFATTVLFAQAPPAVRNDTVTDAQVSSIDAVVGQVKLALAGVQTTLVNSGLPPLKQVKLTLQTVVAKKGGPTLKLWVISVGGTWEKDKTQEMDIVLVPPKAGAPIRAATGAIAAELQQAIIDAAQGIKGANEGAVPLTWSSLDVQLGFTVKSDVTGGASIQLIPITVGFTGDLSKTAVQTLTVTFAAP